MNYRHAFHAGNFADVVKHLALVAILLHMRRKDAAFAVIDSHAGRGLYDLRSDAAQRTGEAEKGIARILASPAGASCPSLFERYVEIVKAAGEGFYPGSPLIVARMLRSQDRFVGIELQRDEADALADALAPFGNKALRSECADGYARLKALLPPPERRGLVLIDPPFESPDEFATVAHALGEALRRFANGIYLLWYPVKSAGDAKAFAGEILACGVKRALRIAIDIGTGESGAKERLTAAGLIVINPPFGFADEMQACLAFAAPLLSHAARSEIRWLAGEDG
jgi:23S rRNA (adenine2030-N6)-methyltransferase